MSYESTINDFGEYGLNDNKPTTLAKLERFLLGKNKTNSEGVITLNYGHTRLERLKIFDEAESVFQTATLAKAERNSNEPEGTNDTYAKTIKYGSQRLRCREELQSSGEFCNYLLQFNDCVHTTSSSEEVHTHKLWNKLLDLKALSQEEEGRSVILGFLRTILTVERSQGTKFIRTVIENFAARELAATSKKYFGDDDQIASYESKEITLDTLDMYKDEIQYIHEQESLFHECKSDLEAEYCGNYVWFEGGIVRDHDRSREALISRIYQKYGMKVIFVELVSDEEPTLQVMTPFLE